MTDRIAFRLRDGRAWSATRTTRVHATAAGNIIDVGSIRSPSS